MEHHVSFGEWLRRRRRALDLTRDELAQRVGFSVSALRKIEADERRPSRQFADLLAQELEILPEDRQTFLQVARGLLPVERLGTPLAVAPAPWSRPVAGRTASNLPAPATPFIGREAELAALAHLLSDPLCRLLTLSGPGGIGKTRVAIEAAVRQQGLYRDGVHFVSLASLDSPAFLVPAIADALGFAFQGQIEPRVQLLNHLSDKQALLVLDNCEHLLQGVGFLAELLERAPGVRLLVTSRERLNLLGEWVFEIQGLPVPASAQIQHVERYSSVALFVQAARRAQAGFELRAEEQPSVLRICQMVEGMPLGIELAAAWVSMLTCREIAQEMENSLDFLATSRRDVPERQRTLRAAFDHSWSLLVQEERRLLCRLALFQGGFERVAAEQVAGATLPLLSALASKSLLHRTKGGRYDLHEMVRQYALLRFADDPQGEGVRDRHSDFYLALLRDRRTALGSAAQGETVGELAHEIDNVRTAWAWAVKRERFTALGPALRSLTLLHLMAGWLREGIEQIELVVQTLRARSDSREEQAILGQALAQQGMLFFRLGQFERAQARYSESLAVLRPLGDPALLTDPLINSGTIMHLSGEIERSQSVLNEGLACARAAGDPWYTAYGQFNLGYVASLLGYYAEGYEQMLGSLEAWRALGDSHYIALGLNYISPTASILGRYKDAEAFLHESLALSTQLGDRWGIGTAYRNLGLVALSQGNIDEAQALLQKGLDTFKGIVTGWDIAQSLIYLGEATVKAGNRLEARRIFVEALHEAMEAQSTLLAMDALTGLAHLHAGAGEAEQSLRLSIYVSCHSASAQPAKDRARQLRLQLEPLLAPQQVERSHGWARAITLETLTTGLLDASTRALPSMNCGEARGSSQ